MDDTERRTAKRSRFDQKEPEPKRSSRFDRRSRSPPATKPERTRSRSPLVRGSDSPATDSKDSVDPAAAAAAAAARINAQIQAKKGVQHVDVPPIRSTLSPSAGKSASPGAGNIASTVNGEMYIADGDYIRDIEVNDLRNRYTLTKGSTQKMIKEDTGADVTTRGNYYPDKSMATAANPPLYLHVTSTTKRGLEQAVEKIEELMKQELPNLVDERRFRRREPDQVERDEFGRRKWPEEKIPINFEPIQGFNLRAQVVGHGGAYVKHIQQETRCRVQIKGRGSGFMEHGTGQESDEEMYLHVAGPDPNEVQKAKELCEDLLKNVREQYEEFKSRPPPQRGYGTQSTGYGGERGYGDRAPDRSSPNTILSPTTPSAPGAASPGAGADYAAQYAQYYAANGQADPYAAYGGYAAYVQYYQQYMAAAAAAQQQAPGAPGSAPPPPPSENPPPPPSGAPPGTGYNNRTASTADSVKEPHSVSLKVLRLSRPSLSVQHSLPTLSLDSPSTFPTPTVSLAYPSSKDDPFILSPLLTLPPAFGSAYVGESFSCTLCANNELLPGLTQPKTISNVKIEAEMKIPSSGTPIPLPIGPDAATQEREQGVDLEPGHSLQRVVNFDLKEEGNHILAVTVTYTETTPTSGRVRTFRKLYQFVCKSCMVVRTKTGALPQSSSNTTKGRKWALEAQLENCGEETITLDTVVLETVEGIRSHGINWDLLGAGDKMEKPVLMPGDVQQVCFAVEEMLGESGEGAMPVDGKRVFKYG
ncbi:Pre-mRNA splicing factor khdc4 [Hyphodiscus hymeniophilus]|uniref:Pre-mRNA splicing factor khdc4 n=1 Tax=Hyphodiscus hymeniophilus TaxID=353542 RepID=A0A9P6VQL9_9HELO|nr:Pre-mRNA splicing factor khdc4 [Hyphodiscus hymeniophilus]